MMERHAVEIIYAIAVFPLPGEVIQMLSNAIQYSCCDKYRTTTCAQANTLQITISFLSTI